MARRAHATVVGLDGRALLAADLSVTGGRVTVRRTATAMMQEGLERSDAAGVGAWMARALSEHGISTKRLTFVARRDEVVLKRITVPASASLSAAELAGLVRLAMSRQTAMGIEGAGLDHVRIGSEPGPDGQWPVLAAAMPAERMAWYRAAAGAAGAKIDGIELAMGGIAAVARGAAERRGGLVLAVAIGPESVEFVVIEDGQVVMGRSVDAKRPASEGEQEAYAARLVVEARRTWMSVSAGQERGGLEAILVLGDDEVARLVMARCEDAALASAVESVGLGPSVEVQGELGREQAALMTLIGVGVRWAEGIDGFDFGRTRRGPDPKARRRQMVLVGVFAAIVGVGGAWVVSQQRLSDFRSARDAARTRMQKLGEQYAQQLVVEARVNAVEQWASAGVDWLAHLKWLSDQMPDPKSGLVDEVTASASAEVRFTPRDRNLPGGQWQTNQQAVFSLSGKVVRREVALDLRGRLVRGDVYRVINQTADTEDRFSFELITSRRSPDDPAPAATGASATPGARPDVKQARPGGGA